MSNHPRHRASQGMACPHCGSIAKVRSSRTLSRLYRERTYQCINPECGHVFIAALEVMRTVLPSACPNPDVRIPLSEHPRAACQQAAKD